MNTQEAYEAIHAHFSKPGAQLAKNEHGSCVYRGSNDAASPLRCAVGCLIPNGLYLDEMEGHEVWDLYDEFPEIESFFSNVNADFLAEAQKAHDSDSSSAEDFIRHLNYIATTRYGLTVAKS